MINELTSFSILYELRETSVVLTEQIPPTACHSLLSLLIVSNKVDDPIVSGTMI